MEASWSLRNFYRYCEKLNEAVILCRLKVDGIRSATDASAVMCMDYAMKLLIELPTKINNDDFFFVVVSVDKPKGAYYHVERNCRDFKKWSHNGYHVMLHSCLFDAFMSIDKSVNDIYVSIEFAASHNVNTVYGGLYDFEC